MIERKTPACSTNARVGFLKGSPPLIIYPLARRHLEAFYPANAELAQVV